MPPNTGHTQIESSQSHWPVVAATLALGGLYMALPDSLALGPRWLHSTLIFALIAAAPMIRWRGDSRRRYWLGLGLASVITIFLVWSLARPVLAVPSREAASTAQR
jgi:uncharacterized membrane protein